MTPWLGWIGAALIAGALGAGLLLTPPDYLQGESVRMMYVHVPAAWLGAGGYFSLAIASAAVARKKPPRRAPSTTTAKLLALRKPK